MRGLLIDVINKEVHKVQVSQLSDYYKAMHCETISTIAASLNGINITIICDEDALCHENPIPCIFDTTGSIVVWNSVIIAGFDPNAEDFVDLPDYAEKEIRKRIVHMKDETPCLQL